MTRILLTLLALLTGFAAAPVQARMCTSDPSGIEQVEGGRGGSAAIAATIAANDGRTVQRQRRTRERKAAPAVRTVFLPTIQYGDRALE